MMTLRNQYVKSRMEPRKAKGTEIHYPPSLIAPSSCNSTTVSEQVARDSLQTNVEYPHRKLSSLQYTFELCCFMYLLKFYLIGIYCKSISLDKCLSTLTPGFFHSLISNVFNTISSQLFILPVAKFSFNYIVTSNIFPDIRKGKIVFSFTVVEIKKNQKQNQKTFVDLVSHSASICISTHHSQLWILMLFLEKIMNGHKKHSSISI